MMSPDQPRAKQSDAPRVPREPGWLSQRQNVEAVEVLVFRRLAAHLQFADVFEAR